MYIYISIQRDPNTRNKKIKTSNNRPDFCNNLYNVMIKSKEVLNLKDKN